MSREHTARDPGGETHIERTDILVVSDDVRHICSSSSRSRAPGKYRKSRSHCARTHAHWVELVASYFEMTFGQHFVDDGTRRFKWLAAPTAVVPSYVGRRELPNCEPINVQLEVGIAVLLDEDWRNKALRGLPRIESERHAALGSIGSGPRIDARLGSVVRRRASAVRSSRRRQRPDGRWPTSNSKVSH
jgi:hypothetical protein